MTATRIRITGTVQGVGFRPFVHRCATGLGLAGTVRNDAHGVVIDVHATAAEVDELCRLLVAEAPPLARVTGVYVEPTDARVPTRGFGIGRSDSLERADVPVSIDVALCDECLAELRDPNDRRFGYPFLTCTNCGPRYTIVTGVPYDRPATTMAGFTMCTACQAEYDDPTDRRFHAQPNACPECGPVLRWWPTDDTDEPPLTRAIDALRAGAIVAVKGVGGYHLACDATSAAAVAELRRRKHRDDKPFAVLVASLADAHQLATFDDDAAAVLASARRPIVLAAKAVGSPVVDAVAPGLPEIGVMLPPSPLHQLLADGVARPLVLTSGNISDEPIAHLDDDAQDRLGPMVDGVLWHDRPIHIRCDDSVVRATTRRLQVLRRSRGWAPEPIPLPVPANREILAVGAELKSTVAVAKGGVVVASHHLGDLEHLAATTAFQQAADHLRRLLDVRPEVVVCDLHPDYRSTQFAEQLAELGVELMRVQHHHAHVAACLVEHQHTAPVVALAFDGLGYGTDGSLWGGEVLVADLHDAERVAHLRAVPLPGGAAAIRQPWRMALVWAGADAVDAVEDSSRRAVLDLAQRPETHFTTSMGRLFDAAASILGVRHDVTYEGQAAIELEARARTVDRDHAPRFEGVTTRDGELDPRMLMAELVARARAGDDPAWLAAGFHETIGTASAALAADIATDRGIDTVVLTGGVFQNARLSEVVEDDLRSRGLDVLVHGEIPPNDGGISIGQAAIAAARS